MDLRFTEVVENRLLVGTETLGGISGQQGTWTSRHRLVLRDGPHPAGMAEGGRQAWERMLTKLDTLLEGSSGPA